jgi:hypothetical protein
MADATPRAVLFAFAVGLSNFGTGRQQRPSDIVAAISELLPLVRPRAR